MKTVEVEIKGTSPLLMNNPLAMIKEVGKKTIKEYKAEDEAKKASYVTKNGTLMIPSDVMRACIMYASSGYKAGKKSARGLLAGVVKIEPFEIELGTKDYKIDTRTVVIQKQRVFKSRARLDEWKAKFKIVYNDKYFPESMAKNLLYQIVEEAGVRYGLMDWRPQKGGSFGTFEITKWDA